MSESDTLTNRVLLKKRKRKVPSLFVTPKPVVVYAKLNGKPEGSTRIVGLTLDEVLTNCTHILKLTSAARRLYFTDGSLVESIDQLRNHPEIFVSQGEQFIDTMKLLRESCATRDMSFWGLNGLYLPKSKPKGQNSSREREQPNATRRVLTFSNGEYLLDAACEILSDLKNIEEFKGLCGSKHNFNGHCKRIFSTSGKEIVDLNSLLVEEPYVWTGQGERSILGPVWVSLREDVDNSAVHHYFTTIIVMIKHVLKKEKKYLDQLNAMREGDLQNVHTSSIKSYSKLELKLRTKESEEKVKRLRSDLERFRSGMDCMSDNTTKAPSQSEQPANEHFKGSHGLRLMVYTNGKSSDTQIKFFFNVDQAKKGIDDAALLFSRLLDDLSKNVHLTKVNDHSRGILVRRIFTEDGVEVKDVADLTSDQTVLVSHGEDWINPRSFYLSGKVHFMDETLEEASGDLGRLKNYKLSKKMAEKDLVLNLPVFENKKVPRSYIMLSLSVSDVATKGKWSMTKNGRIFLKEFPSVSLTVFTEGKKTITLPEPPMKRNSKDSHPETIGYTVQLYPTQFGNPFQSWEFTSEGLLRSKGDPSMCLTFLSSRTIAPHESFFDVVTDANVCATEVLSDPLDSIQRWGFRNLAQSKLCDQPNSDWQKAALIWPFKDDGSLNDALQWPLNGDLVVSVPPPKKVRVASDTRFPLKLNVLKNSDHTNNKAVLVAGPDLSKLVRLGRNDQYETHCSNESLLLQEFQMFLDNCTCSLRLPSAARRLFDKDGKELTILEGLKNYDHVCVSMGEVWSSPESTLTKIQLRSYANKLAVDVERLKNFIGLYRPDAEFVLGAQSNSLEKESVVEVQLLNDQSKKELKRIIDEDNHIPIPEPVKEIVENNDMKHKSFHEKSCDAAKMRYLKNNDNVQSTNTVDVTHRKDHDSHSDTVQSINLQQFTYERNYIFVSSNRKYCLRASEIGGNVTIRKINTMCEDSLNKWIVHRSGVIESMYYRGFVLTITSSKMLPFHDRCTSEYKDATISLEKAVNTKYGSAHQRFNIVARSGLIYPFCTNQLDKAVTSAVTSSICTRFVTPKAMVQQGYMVDMKKSPDGHQKTVPICMSCVSVLNGRFPITAFEDCHKSFVCSYYGGFKVIRNADLSPENAEDVYQFYVKKLQDIKEQLIIKPCKNRISMTPIKNIKVLLYKNGNGWLNPPRVVISKSISQIMETASNVLNLQRPVRILYTETGEAVVDELSFANVMCDSKVKGAIEEAQKSDEHTEGRSDVEGGDSEDNDQEVKVSLSSDTSYFTVESAGNPPTAFYSIEIFISNISGMTEFHKMHQDPNIYHLVNYEIFNNQINTDLFHGDSDFESEVTELTVKSSTKALKRLFSKDMSVLRLQLISATVENVDEGTEEMKLDIKSINAFADVDLLCISERIEKISEEIVTESLICSLVSTESFRPTAASVTVEVSVKLVDQIPKKISDEDTVIKVQEGASEYSESIITQPYFTQGSNLIELWASTGEPFSLPPEDGSRSSRRRTNQMKQEMYNKKFQLRNMTGERLKSLNVGTMEATSDGKNPVMIKGNWMFPSKKEMELNNQIEFLGKKISKIKLQSSNKSYPCVSGQLYSQKHLKNCFVYLNGDKECNVVSAWGETLYDIMQNAANLLQLKKNPKCLFKSDGQQVKSIEEITPGIRLALSHHSTYISAEDVKLRCEVKANWGRARSKHGEKSTELQIRHRPITVIDVDPFDPPDTMRPKKSISEDYKTFKVFENGQPSSSAVTICGNSFPGVLMKAAVVLGLSAAVKCFYTLDGTRIVYFKEILNDDLLAASVTGMGFVINEDI